MSSQNGHRRPLRFSLRRRRFSRAPALVFEIATAPGLERRRMAGARTCLWSGAFRLRQEWLSLSLSADRIGHHERFGRALAGSA
jgi:hypothetical protein